ncbi:hypothetical protein HJC99_05520 [Candidatus Saccharibacteria bacterium]|nr:hypothetical protein [Candidatus Saccharibacteria bacterium]
MGQIPLTQIQVFRDATPSVIQLKLQEQEVTAYWQVIFSLHGIATLTKQDITGFLRYEQNKRWREISKENVAADMDALRAALTCLVDDSQPLAERLNRLEPGHGDLAVPHLGKAKLTPILLVSHPRQYGVWNDYSENALRGLGLMPEFTGMTRLGDQYRLVNDVLVQLAADNMLTLWWLDVILEQIARLVHD